MNIRCPSEACNQLLIRNFEGKTATLKCSGRSCGIEITIRIPAPKGLTSPRIVATV